MKRFLKFFAPDGDNTGGAAPAIPTMEVPEVAPAMAETTITDVDLGTSPAEEVAGPKVLSPKDAGFDDPEDEMERMEAAMEKRPVRERGPDGKFIPKGGKKPEEAAKVPAKPVAKPAAKKPEPVQEKPTKFKIGDEEKTPDEWAAELKEAREKLKAAEPAKPTELPKEETKPEDQQKADEDRFNEFIKTTAAKYKLSADPKAKDSIDNILAGGENATELLAQYVAKVEANTRVAVTAEFNRVISNIKSEMQPLIDHHKTISEYQTESGFLSANPEIQNHPEGYKTYKETKALFEKAHTDIKEKIANGTATPRDQGWNMMYEAQTPEEFQSSLALHTKEALAKLPAPVPAGPAAPKLTDKSPNAKPTPAVIKPFNGDRPNGGSAPLRTESDQARHMREMADH